MEWERLKTIVEALYKRPKQLSDPSSDFSQEELDALIATPDEAMVCYDFMCIFQTFCPAGCYEECAYFIPLAVKYIETNCSDALSVLDCLLGWMDENREQLKRDNLWMAAASCLCQIIGREMLRFELEAVASDSHFWAYPNSGREWFDTLRRSEGARPSALGLIVLGMIFREHFSHIDSYPVAAWLVYLGTHTLTFPYHVYLAARLADTATREAACRPSAPNAGRMRCARAFGRPFWMNWPRVMHLMGAPRPPAIKTAKAFRRGQERFTGGDIA